MEQKEHFCDLIGDLFACFKMISINRTGNEKSQEWLTAQVKLSDSK
jgi:hypothetical protein